MSARTGDLMRIVMMIMMMVDVILGTS
jgi:hypothetical protein